MNEYGTGIGLKIKEIRKRRNFSQKAFAVECEISPTYLCQIENGTRTPTLDLLDKMSQKLKIPLPVLSFLTLDAKSVQPDKVEAFSKIKPAIMALVEEFFLQE